MANIKSVVDDVFNGMGQLVPAHHLQTPLAFDGRKVKLDLCADNYSALRDVLAPWFDAVESQPTPVVSVPAAGFSGLPEGTKGDKPVVSEFAMWNVAGALIKRPGIQQFAQQFGKSGVGAPDRELVKAYEAARASGAFVPDPLKYPPNLQRK